MLMLSLTPIILLILLLFGLKWPLIKAAPLACLLTALLALGPWGVNWAQFFGPFLKAALLSADIMLIVFGAIFFLNFLRHQGQLESMQTRLKGLSSDKRAQALLLAWLFGSFIEGVSGFGTPAAIVAPLLVGLGFSPVNAILISLLANSTAVTFGAVGTPMRIGFGGMDTTGVAPLAALINILPGLMVPFWILNFAGKEEGSKGLSLRAIPLALGTGAAFLVPYYLFSLLGGDFPSLFGGAAGTILGVLFLKSKSKLGELLEPFSPYILLMTLLVAGKFLFVLNLSVPLPGGLNHRIQFFNPGFAFLTAILILGIKRKVPLSELREISTQALIPLSKAGVSIFFIGALTYLMITSGMLKELALALMTRALPLYSAFIGAFGSFLAGSATVSNLLLGELQMRAAQDMALSLPLILALQLVGAAAGNMIALPNILAVQAAVETEGKEALVLKRLLLPCLAYLLLASLMGLLIPQN